MKSFQAIIAFLLVGIGMAQNCRRGERYCGSSLVGSQGFELQDLRDAISASSDCRRVAREDPMNALYECHGRGEITCEEYCRGRCITRRGSDSCGRRMFGPGAEDLNDNDGENREDRPRKENGVQ